MQRNSEGISSDPMEEVYADTAAYIRYAERSFPWLQFERPALLEHVREKLAINSDIKVIEAGCGYGRVIQELISAGVQPDKIVGMDHNPKLLEIARDRFSPAVEIVEADLAAESFIDHQADLVICNMVAHHLNDDQFSQMVGNFCRWTKQDGTFLILLPFPLFSRLQPHFSGVPGNWAYFSMQLLLPLLSEDGSYLPDPLPYTKTGRETRQTAFGVVTHFHRTEEQNSANVKDEQLWFLV